MKETEYEAQVKVFKWASEAEIKYPELKWLFSTLNGVRLNIGQAVKAKKTGLKAGIPDIIMPYPNKNHKALFLELKVGRNKASKEQIECISFLTENGYFATVAFGSDEAIDFIVDYLEGHI
jgi:hypothetical protein